MNLHELPPVVTYKRKRLGRGVGSGKGGHTSSRGQKGQKSRESVNVSFFGTKVKLSLLKKLPFLRGKGKQKPMKDALAVNVARLNVFPNGAKVGIDSLIEARVIKPGDRKRFIKIVSGGSLNKKLEVNLPTTRTARGVIIGSGGTAQ